MFSKPVKLLIVIALLSALVIGVAPALIGLGMRDIAINDPLAMLAPETRAQIQIRESSFENGWFRSQAALDMVYTPLGDLPLNMQLQMQIQHGPILFTDDGLAFGLAYARMQPRFDSSEIREALAELPFELPVVAIDLLSRFNGSLVMNVNASPVNYDSADEQFSFSGLQARFVVNADMSAEFALSTDSLTARESGTSFAFSLSGLNIRTDTSQINDLLAPGSASVNIASISSDSPYPLSVNGIAINSRLQTSTAGADRTDIYQRIQVENIDSDFPLQSLAWTSEINETRTELFRTYIALLTELQEQVSANTGVITTQINQSGQELALMFLQNRIVLNNLIAASAYDGDHQLDLRINWNGLPDLNDVARLDINAALAAVTISIDMSLDLEAVARSPLADMVDTYVQQEILRLDNGRIFLQASLINSELTLNGDSIALDQFF